MCMEKIRNYTQMVSGEPMTAGELVTAREVLGYGQSDLARALGTSLRNVQEWESGRRKMKGLVSVTIGLLSERSEWVMGKVLETVDSHLAGNHPGGIVSAGVDLELLKRRLVSEAAALDRAGLKDLASGLLLARDIILEMEEQINNA